MAASSRTAATLAAVDVGLTFIMYRWCSEGPWKPRTSMACRGGGGGRVGGGNRSQCRLGRAGGGAG